MDNRIIYNLTETVSKLRFVRLSLLAILWFGMANGASAQDLCSGCNYLAGDSIKINSTGGSTGTEYSVAYALTSLDSTIIDTSSSLSFAGQATGSYLIFPFAWKIDNAPANILAGNTIDMISGGCSHIGDPIALNVCPQQNTVCNYVQGSTVELDIAGGAGAGYLTRYVLVDSLGTIAGISSTPELELTAEGNYLIYALNYKDDASLAGLTVGGNFCTVSAECSDISDPLFVQACENSVNPIVDFNTTLVDVPVSGNIKTNDNDPEGDDTYIASIAGTPVPSVGTVTVPTENGSLEIDSLGNYTYTPNPGYVGKDSIVYTLTDGKVSEDEVLYLNILPLSNPSDPSTNITVANPDEGTSYGDPIDLSLLANDSDPEQDVITLDGVEDPNNPGTYVTTGTISNLPGVDTEGNTVANAGSLTMNADGTVTYTPTAGFEGTVNPLNYATKDDVTGANMGTDTSKIYLDVLFNDPKTDEPPVAADDYQITDINTPIVGDWLSNDSDPNVDSNDDRIGVNGGMDNINPNNPTGTGAVIETLTTEKGGTVDLKDDGTFLYTPPAGYSGPDQVVYYITDTVDVAHTDSATIYLLIEPSNSIDPTVDYNTTLVDVPVDGNVKTNDNDPEGDDTYIAEIAGTPVPSTGTVTVATENGSLEIDSLGNYTYTPNPGYSGLDSVVYTLTDGGVSKQEVLYLTILPASDPSDPTTNATVAITDEGTSYGDPIGLDLLANDSDPEQDVITFDGVEDPNTPGTYLTTGTISNLPGVDAAGNAVANAGSLTMNADGTVTYTPAPGFVGTVNPLNYATKDDVTGANMGTDTSKIYLDVLFNDPKTDEPPVAADDYQITDINTPIVGDWLSNDSDPNVDSNDDRIGVNGGMDNINPNNPTGTGAVIETLTTEKGGTVDLKDDGTFLYTPPADYSGPDQVVYSITDTTGVAHTDSATIYLMIEPVKKDYGDLTAFDVVGAKYLDVNGDDIPDGKNSVWSGASISDEPLATTNTSATADAGDDGLVIPAVLDSTMANVYKVDISSVKEGITAHAQLEIDWNGDGIVDSTYRGSVVTTVSGNDTVLFADVNTPVGFTGGTVNYRVRVTDDVADLNRAMQNNGEVEDYQETTATPVPVELIALEGDWDDVDAVIEWSTATEINNDFFLVQRSFDGITYTDMDVVYTKALGGISSEVLHYSYTDYNVKSITRKEVYYRLVQTDYDGTEAILGPVVLTVDKSRSTDLNVYPVPARDFVTITTNDLVQGREYRLNIIDNFGKIVREINVTASDNEMDIIIDLNGLRSAVYWVSILGEDLDLNTQKFIKLN